jgi:hypothetical protein
MQVQWVCFLTEPPSRLHTWGRDHTRSSSSCRAMLLLLCLHRSPIRSLGIHRSPTRSLGTHHSPTRLRSRVCHVPGRL